MNTSTRQLAYGADTISFNEWHQLDQLWLLLTKRSEEFSVSYSYGERTRSRWLQFSNLIETRYPISGDLTVSQRLSNRPVVAQPNQPIHVPCDGRVKLFVGTSLWFCLARDEDVLLDVPVMRLSDTWFGPDTMNGEVCYACETHARLTMESARVNPFKAITPIEIINRGDAPLVVDRVNIPVPYLCLYQGKDRHWTSKLTIVRRATDADSSVRVGDDAPLECKQPTLISAAREHADDGIMHKAMSLLLG